jgi:anti-anti-sigma factor
MVERKRLAITDDLTIYHALALKQQLLSALEDADIVELDLAQVAEIDSAGLQLLILAKRESDRQGKQLSIVAHSPEVRQTIDFCNLAAFFGDPVIITAQEEA